MQKELKQISFKRMNNDEFRIYSRWSVEAYAEHLIKSGDEKFRFKARKAAQSEFNDIFPEGADSADNYLYVVVNEKGEKIGEVVYKNQNGIIKTVDIKSAENNIVFRMKVVLYQSCLMMRY